MIRFWKLLILNPFEKSNSPSHYRSVVAGNLFENKLYTIFQAIISGR